MSRSGSVTQAALAGRAGGGSWQLESQLEAAVRMRRMSD